VRHGEGERKRGEGGEKKEREGGKGAKGGEVRKGRGDNRGKRRVSFAVLRSNTGREARLPDLDMHLGEKAKTPPRRCTARKDLSPEKGEGENCGTGIKAGRQTYHLNSAQRNAKDQGLIAERRDPKKRG